MCEGFLVDQAYRKRRKHQRAFQDHDLAKDLTQILVIHRLTLFKHIVQIVKVLVGGHDHDRVAQMDLGITVGDNHIILSDDTGNQAILFDVLIFSRKSSESSGNP